MRKALYPGVGLIALLGAAVVAATAIGSVPIPLSTTLGLLLSSLPFLPSPSYLPGAETIILDIRLPRVFQAALVGAALSTAGAAYQGLFRNPMADPYLIGVAQGAALGAIVGFLAPLPLLGVGGIPLLAFAGALMAVAAVYAIARVGRTLPLTTLILAGVAMGVFLSSIISFLMLFTGQELRAILFWLLGGFSLARWSEVGTALPYIAAGMAVILLHARPLNIMQLDEEQAQQLGVAVERVKLTLIVAATLITAAAVAFVGTIGFVGLIVPHMVRLLWGPDHRRLLPLCLLSGSLFLVLADALARTLLSPVELPVGVVTAFTGAPFFLYLLRWRKRMVF